MLPLLLFLACQPKAEPATAAEPPAPAEAPPPTPPPPPAEPPAPPRCGGIAGFVCPDDRACVDDPTDSCVPGRGADCMGICLTCDDPALAAARDYKGTPEQCPLMKFGCPEGQVTFMDHCGCGCAKVP